MARRRMTPGGRARWLGIDPDAPFDTYPDDPPPLLEVDPEAPTVDEVAGVVLDITSVREGEPTPVTEDDIDWDGGP